MIGLDSEREQEYAESDTYENDRLFWQVAVKRALIEKTNSLAYKHPKIAQEWDYDKNYPALPTQVEAQSNLDAWWICPVCKESYPARISHRTVMGSGCSYCAGKKVTPEISFAGRHPEALKDWDWRENENANIDPYKLTPNSNVVCHWKCEHGHTYPTSPNKKVAALKLWGKYSGCRQCYRERGRKSA